MQAGILEGNMEASIGEISEQEFVQPIETLPEATSTSLETKEVSTKPTIFGPVKLCKCLQIKVALRCEWMFGSLGTCGYPAVKTNL